MPLKYLLDENVRGVLWSAIESHNGRGVNPLDAVCVGDPPDLALSSPDPAILLWAEREGRIVLSLDQNTMPGHLASHLRAGHHSPGLFLLRRNVSVKSLITFLEAAAYASEAADWQDAVTWVP
jgi:hypothetical protein